MTHPPLLWAIRNIHVLKSRLFQQLSKKFQRLHLGYLVHVLRHGLSQLALFHHEILLPQDDVFEGLNDLGCHPVCPLCEGFEYVDPQTIRHRCKTLSMWTPRNFAILRDHRCMSVWLFVGLLQKVKPERFACVSQKVWVTLIHHQLYQSLD